MLIPTASLLARNLTPQARDEARAQGAAGPGPGADAGPGPLDPLADGAEHAAAEDPRAVLLRYNTQMNRSADQVSSAQRVARVLAHTSHGADYGNHISQRTTKAFHTLLELHAPPDPNHPAHDHRGLAERVAPPGRAVAGAVAAAAALAGWHNQAAAAAAAAPQTPAVQTSPATDPPEPARTSADPACNSPLDACQEAPARAAHERPAPMNPAVPSAPRPHPTRSKDEDVSADRKFALATAISKAAIAKARSSASHPGSPVSSYADSRWTNQHRAAVRIWLSRAGVPGRLEGQRSAGSPRRGQIPAEEVEQSLTTLMANLSAMGSASSSNSLRKKGSGARVMRERQRESEAGNLAAPEDPKSPEMSSDPAPTTIPSPHVNR